MTYPPQQPGPYGQDPYGQQPQQPYGGQYGQAPWGQQPGYPVGPPPPKKRGGLIAALIIVAILVVGGGGVGLYFLLSNDKKDNNADSGDGGDKTTARAAADAYVKALQTALNTEDLDDVDLKPLKPLACTEDYEALEDSLEAAKENQETSSPEKREKLEITIEDFKETKNGATFTMVRQRENDDDTGKVDMDVTKKGDSYEVCGLTASDDESGGGGGPTTSRPIPNPIPTT